MKKLFLENAGTIAAFYLGGSLSMYVTVIHWQWWIIVIPTIVLFGIENYYNQHKDEK